MVQMEDDRLGKQSQKWICEGQDVVNIGFVASIEEMEGEPVLFSPEFVHQHFGENETIFGYEDLSVNIFYSDVSLYFFPEISFSKEVSKVDKDLKADDILKLVRDQLPEDQMDIIVESKDVFQTILLKQKNFKPFGEMISKFTSRGKNFELYKVSESDEEGFDKYLARAQTLALWYIDAAQYTDNTDPLWVHYFLYERKISDEGDGSVRYSLAGYSSLYRFYAYPQNERPRIAQILLLPQYRGGGNGAKLLQSIYNDLYTKVVLDITAEDPADNFIYLRDYVDSVNCAQLPEFSPERLKKGFSVEMKNAANTKLKLNKRQIRRVYEILRLMHTDVSNADEMKAYRIDVKRRLEAPMRRELKDWNKITKALDQEELAQVAATQLSSEQKLEQLQKLFEQAVEGYRITINRLKTYPSIF